MVIEEMAGGGYNGAVVKRRKPVEIGKIHNGYSHDLENRILFAMVPTVAKYMNADALSIFALAGTAVMCGAIFASGVNIWNLLWVIPGMMMHWFGDGLDGKVARYRNEGRPRYGYYIDRIFDDMSTALILIFIHISKLTNSDWWLYVLVLTLLLWSHLFLKASVTGMFEMQIGRFGGLELKGLAIGLIVMVVLTNNPVTTMFGAGYTYLDISGMVLTGLMTLMFVYSVTTSLTGKGKIRD